MSTAVAWQPRQIGAFSGSSWMPLSRAIALASGVASEAQAFACAVASQWLYWLAGGLVLVAASAGARPHVDGLLDRLRPQPRRHPGRRCEHDGARDKRGGPHRYRLPCSTRRTWSAFTSFHSLVVPSGQRTWTRSAVSAAPSPKWARVSPCDR